MQCQYDKQKYHDLLFIKQIKYLIYFDNFNARKQKYFEKFRTTNLTKQTNKKIQIKIITRLQL